MISILKNRKIQLVAFIVIAGLVIGGFTLFGGGGGTEEGKAKGTIKIGHNNWAENIAVSNMWKTLLEEQGYRVEMLQTEKAPLWTGVANGSVDIIPEIWLPNTDKPFYDKYKDKLELNDTWYKGTYLGLAVPTYMKDINTIEDLEKNKDLFTRQGKPSIVGIDSGASLMRMTEEVIEEYGLNYHLIESSESAMLGELQTAYRKEEPIVVTLWNPHWVFSKYDLKYLKDSKKVYGEEEEIYFATREGFKDDFGEVVQWMNNWEMDDDSLGSLMEKIEETGDPEKGAREWIEENQQLVDEWIK